MKKKNLVLMFFISASIISCGETNNNKKPNERAVKHSNTGFTKYNLKDYKGAIADFTKVIELDPDYVYAYFWRGMAKNKLENYQGAIADFTKVIELDPNNADAYYNRGIKKSILKDLSGACADLRKSVILGRRDSQNFIGEKCN